MKFGKQIERCQVAGWERYYVAYKTLKKTLKGAENAKAILDKSWSKGSVNKHDFQEQYAAIWSSSNAFMTLLNQELIKCCHFLGLMDSRLGKARKRTEIARSMLHDDASGDLDAMEQFVWTYGGHLASFVEMNYTAFFKALKKHDKCSGLMVSPVVMAIVDASPLGVAAHSPQRRAAMASTGLIEGAAPLFSHGDQTAGSLSDIMLLMSPGDEAGELQEEGVPSLLKAVGYDGRVTSDDMPRLISAAKDHLGEEIESDIDDGGGDANTLDSQQRRGSHQRDGTDESESQVPSRSQRSMLDRLAIHIPSSPRNVPSSSSKLAKVATLPAIEERSSGADMHPSEDEEVTIPIQAETSRTIVQFQRQGSLIPAGRLREAADLLVAATEDEIVGMPLEDGPMADSSGPLQTQGTLSPEYFAGHAHISTVTAAGLVALLHSKVSNAREELYVETGDRLVHEPDKGLQEELMSRLTGSATNRKSLLNRSLRADSFQPQGPLPPVSPRWSGMTPQTSVSGVMSVDPNSGLLTVSDLPSILQVGTEENEAFKSSSDGGAMPGDDMRSAKLSRKEDLLNDFDLSLSEAYRASESALQEVLPELVGGGERVKERLKRMARYTLGLLHAHSRVAHRAAEGATVESLHDAILAEKLVLARLQLKLLVSAVEQTSPEMASALEIVTTSQHSMFLRYMPSRLRAPTQTRVGLVQALRRQANSESSVILSDLNDSERAYKQGDADLSNTASTGVRAKSDASATSESELDDARKGQKALTTLARFGSINKLQAGTGAGTGLTPFRGRFDSHDSAHVFRSDTRLVYTPRTEKMQRGRLLRSGSEISAAKALGLEGVLLQASDFVPLSDDDTDEANEEGNVARRASMQRVQPIGSDKKLIDGCRKTAQESPFDIHHAPSVHGSAAVMRLRAYLGLGFGPSEDSRHSRQTWVQGLSQLLDLAPPETQLAELALGRSGSLHVDASKPFTSTPSRAIGPLDVPRLLWLRFRPPVLDWLPTEYRPTKSLKNDVLAGVTIGVMMVPQGLACATLAGLPAQYGLWSGMLPAVVYFLLGTSRHAAVGPMSVPALLLAAGVSRLSPTSIEEHARLVLTATFLSGVIFMIMGWTGTGFITRFVSRPVLSGFQSAVAILTMASVMKDALGVSLPRASVLQDLLSGLLSKQGIGSRHGLSIAVAGAAFIVLIGSTKVPYLKAIPTALVTVVLFVIIFAIATAAGNVGGVALVGKIPSGWPSFILPIPASRDELALLAPVAASVAVVGLLEHLAVSSNYALKHGYEWAVSSELKALGAANAVGAALSGSMFTAGAFGRSAVFDASDGKSQVGQLVSAVTVIILQAAILPALSYLPRPVLASIIAMSVSKLIDIQTARKLWSEDPRDALVLATALLATLFAGVLEGVLFAALASLLLFLAQTTRPAVEELGRLSGTVLYQTLGSVGVETVGGLKILRFLAPLFYANAPVLKERLLAELGRRKRMPPRLKWKALVLCFSAVASIDSTAISLVRECMHEAHAQGVMVLISSANPYVTLAMERAGFVNALGGQGFITRRVHEAVRAVLMRKVCRSMLPVLPGVARTGLGHPGRGSVSRP